MKGRELGHRPVHVQRAAGRPRFRVRLAGTEVVRRCGEITGKMLAEIDLDRRGEAIEAVHAAAVAGRAPIVSGEQYVRRDGRYMRYRRLLCPLSPDGRSVDMLFGVLASTRRAGS